MSIDHPSRRTFLKATAAAICAPMLGCVRDADPGAFVTDVARLERTGVAGIVRPDSAAGVAEALRQWAGPVSIGGGRYSMGGQIAAPGSLHLDMRSMNRLVELRPHQRIVRCQAGMRWRDLLDRIDPHGLSVMTMQSYSNFTVGGSVSVNCHGRYVGNGAVAGSVRALQLVTAGGQVLELDRTRDRELFGAVIGGYGGLGVVTEVELDLAVNRPLERKIERVPLADYPAYFARHVEADPDVVMHNADLMPPQFDQPIAISWVRTPSRPTIEDRLISRDADYSRDQNLIWAVSELPGAEWLRAHHEQRDIHAPAPVVWRNYEASLDADSLEPRTRSMSTYLLQEYFIPIDRFHAFVHGMRSIVQRADANVLNVSIRHAPADTLSLMRWAAGPVFCFVLYFKQRNTRADTLRSDAWTRQLIELSLSLGGRYYLPYRPAATLDQFRRAYPESRRFAQLKNSMDPQRRFRNRMWEKYLLPGA